jgi:5-methylcytosine-specific restriction endonuclease McrA
VVAEGEIQISTKRDYSEQRKYNARPENIKKREANNRARYMMEKEGKVSVGDGKDVDHIKPQSKGGKTTQSNLRVVSEHDNRSFHRDTQDRWKGPSDNLKPSIAMEHLKQNRKVNR